MVVAVVWRRRRGGENVSVFGMGLVHLLVWACGDNGRVSDAEGNASPSF